MNKIVLKIQFIDKLKLKITLVYLGKFFIDGYDSKIKCFTNKDFNFCLYSRQSFVLNDNSVRFPNKKYYDKKEPIEKEFINEEKMYKFLKGLYDCLNEWNEEYGNEENTTRINKIKLNNEYWII
jgi:hypothetical protein